MSFPTSTSTSTTNCLEKKVDEFTQRSSLWEHDCPISTELVKCDKSCISDIGSQWTTLSQFDLARALHHLLLCHTSFVQLSLVNQMMSKLLSISSVDKSGQGIIALDDGIRWQVWCVVPFVVWSNRQDILEFLISQFSRLPLLDALFRSIESRSHSMFCWIGKKLAKRNITPTDWVPVVRRLMAVITDPLEFQTWMIEVCLLTPGCAWNQSQPKEFVIRDEQMTYEICKNDQDCYVITHHE